MKYLIAFILIWTGLLGASSGGSHQPDRVQPDPDQQNEAQTQDIALNLLDRILNYEDPQQFKSALEEAKIPPAEAIQKLKEKLEKSQDLEERERLQKLIQVLESEENKASEEAPSATAITPPVQGQNPGAYKAPGTSAGILSMPNTEGTARAVDAVVSLRGNQIIDAMLKEAQQGPLLPERAEHYERQIKSLPSAVASEVKHLFDLERRRLDEAVKRQESPSSSNFLMAWSRANQTNLTSEMDALSASYRQSIGQTQSKARDYLSVASTQATSVLLQNRNLGAETTRFSKQVTEPTFSAAEDFSKQLRDRRTVDTGEVDANGKPIKVLPFGEIAEGLREDYAKLAEAARQRSLNPELQQRVERAFEQARDRFGEERVNNILTAAARGADITPLLPQGPENARARLELQELARTAANLQRVDTSVLSTAGLGAQIIDEKQFKTFRNESGFGERAKIAGNVDSLVQKASSGVQEALGLMRSQGIPTQISGMLGPDNTALGIRAATLGQAPNGWLPASYIKLGEQATELQPVIERLRSLAPGLARAQNPEEFGRIYDEILATRKDLQHRLARLERTAEGYVDNAKLTKSLAVTGGAIAAGSLTGGTATGVILAATASSTVRGGIELVDGATSKKGVDWLKVRNETIMGAVDTFGGAAATKAANFTNTVLAQSLKTASPAVQSLAYVGNYALIEGGWSGVLSGGMSAHLEGKSILEGVTQGFLWGTLIGGGIRGVHLAASGGVPRVPHSSAPKPAALDSYPDGAFEAAQRIAKSRGIKVADFSEAELHTIGQRQLEIEALAREKGISAGEARIQLERMGLLLSGQNSMNKLIPFDGGRGESLHRVVSRVLEDLPDNFHALPHSQRLLLAEQQLQSSFRIDAKTPFIPELGKADGSLLKVLSEAIADIRPITTATPRYRSVPLPEGGVRSLDDAQRLFKSDASGYVHTSTLEGATNFNSGSQQKAVFVYPKGADGFVINGEGPVFSEAKALQGSMDPRRAQTFASNDWGVLPNGLRASRFTQEADGTVMIYLERRSVPTTARERLMSATGSQNVSGAGAGTSFEIIAAPTSFTGRSTSIPVGASNPNGAGSGQDVITGAFDSPFKRVRDDLAARAADGTLGGGRSPSGMVEVYYPSTGEPTTGVSKNLRKGKTPGPTDLHTDEANATIAAGRARGEHGWHPPGQCGLCDAMRKAGVSATRATGDSSVAFPVRDGFLYPQAVPQCKSCQTLGVEDLATRTQTQISVSSPTSTSSQDLSPDWFRYFWNAR